MSSPVRTYSKVALCARILLPARDRRSYGLGEGVLSAGTGQRAAGGSSTSAGEGGLPALLECVSLDLDGHCGAVCQINIYLQYLNWGGTLCWESHVKSAILPGLNLRSWVEGELIRHN